MISASILPVARIEPIARSRASSTRYGEMRGRLAVRQGQPGFRFSLNPGYGLRAVHESCP
jgi:hypothetical protein